MDILRKTKLYNKTIKNILRITMLTVLVSSHSVSTTIANTNVIFKYKNWMKSWPGTRHVDTYTHQQKHNGNVRCGSLLFFNRFYFTSLQVYF